MKNTVFTPINSDLLFAEDNAQTFLIVRMRDNGSILVYDWNLSDDDIDRYIEKFKSTGLQFSDREGFTDFEPAGMLHTEFNGFRVIA